MKAIVIRKRILHRIVLRYVRPASTNSGLQVTRCRLERHSGHDTTVNKQYYKCHPARDLITIQNRGNCFSQLFINRAVIFTCDKGSLINAYRYVRWHSLFSRFFLSAPEYCTSAPCLNGGTCKETVTGYSCHCKSRFRGDNCEGIQGC